MGDVIAVLVPDAASDPVCDVVLGPVTAVVLDVVCDVLVDPVVDSFELISFNRPSKAFICLLRVPRVAAARAKVIIPKTVMNAKTIKVIILVDAAIIV